MSGLNSFFRLVVADVNRNYVLLIWRFAEISVQTLLLTPKRVYTQVPWPQGCFSKRRRKYLVTVVSNIVTWVITLLTHHRGVITIPPIRNEVQILLVQHDQSPDHCYPRFSFPSKKQKRKLLEPRVTHKYCLFHGLPRLKVFLQRIAIKTPPPKKKNPKKTWDGRICYENPHFIFKHILL